MKRISAILLTLCMVFALCACGAQKTTSEYSYESAAGAPAYDYYYEENSGLSSTSESIDSSSYRESPAESDVSGSSETRSEKIIYSASVTLETMSFDDTLAGVAELIKSYGGFIESSSVSGSNLDQLNRGSSSRQSASYTIRVPSENFDAMLNSLSTLGNVPYKNVYSDNITSQYYDLDARLNNYQVQEKRLLELIDQAENVSEVIEIERELSDVRYKIESVQSTLKNWDNQVSYSSVYLSVNEVKKYEPSGNASFFSKLGDAFEEGFEMLGDFVLGLISIFPILIFVAVIVTGIVHTVKKVNKKRRAKKEAKIAPANEVEMHENK